MESMPSGMVTEANEEQPENADAPMEVKLDGRTTDSREEQL